MQTTNPIYLQSYYTDYYTSKWLILKYGTNCSFPTQQLVNTVNISFCTIKGLLLPIFWLLLEWFQNVNPKRPAEVVVEDGLLTWLMVGTKKPSAFWDSECILDSERAAVQVPSDLALNVRWLGTAEHGGLPATIVLLYLIGRWSRLVNNVEDLIVTRISKTQKLSPSDILNLVLTKAKYSNTPTGVVARLTPLFKYSFFMRQFISDDEFLIFQRLCEKDFAEIEVVIEIDFNCRLPHVGQLFFLTVVVNSFVVGRA